MQVDLLLITQFLIIFPDIFRYWLGNICGDFWFHNYFHTPDALFVSCGRYDAQCAVDCWRKCMIDFLL